MNERHTITLNAKAFDTLKSFGRFGESVQRINTEADEDGGRFSEGEYESN